MYPYGVEAYLRERARTDRRLARVLSAVSGAAAALFGLVLLLSAVEYARTGRLPQRSLPEFFGFEGREQYVRRIYLETSGPPGPKPGRPTIYFPSVATRRGGRRAVESSADPHARPETRRIGEGPGESSADLLARARVLYGGSSVVVQSEDLVIEELVRPEYPENARERNAEGLIAFVATSLACEAAAISSAASRGSTMRHDRCRPRAVVPTTSPQSAIAVRTSGTTRALSSTSSAPAASTVASVAGNRSGATR